MMFEGEERMSERRNGKRRKRMEREETIFLEYNRTISILALRQIQIEEQGREDIIVPGTRMCCTSGRAFLTRYQILRTVKATCTYPRYNLYSLIKQDLLLLCSHIIIISEKSSGINCVVENVGFDGIE